MLEMQKRREMFFGDKEDYNLDIYCIKIIVPIWRREGFEPSYGFSHKLISRN